MRESSKVAVIHGERDVVWYWNRSLKQWSEALPSCWPEYKGIQALQDDIRRMGYVAHKGLRSIGKPEGPPSEEELADVLGGYGTGADGERR